MAIDLSNRRFGMLLVIARAPKIPNDRHAQWTVKCDCGNIVVRSSSNLLFSNYKSCGCAKGGAEGLKGTREYTSWQEMKTRCYNKNRTMYYRYGGRGIKVCDRWINSPKNFIEDMGLCPEGYTLDRIDNNGDYCKENCRWASVKEQCRNTGRNRYVETPLGKMLMTDAVTISKLPYATLQYRLNNSWPTEKLFDRRGR